MRVLCPETPGAILECMRHLSVSGDYYEFGVFDGHSLQAAYHAARELGYSEMRFWGFDSFCGLPEPTGLDCSPEWRRGLYACERERVIGNLGQAGVNLNAVTLVEGFFGVILPLFSRQVTFPTAALALVDCDLYASAVPVLDFLTPLLKTGSVLMFDDYNCFEKDDQRGERRAFREWLARNPHWQAAPLSAWSWHGQAFVLNPA